MRDMLETQIDGALGEIINTPTSPGDALIAGIHAKAKKSAAQRNRKAALWAAAAALLFNASLASTLVYSVIKLFGESWVSAAALGAGLMLVMLPSVLLLSLGDLQQSFKRANKNTVG